MFAIIGPPEPVGVGPDFSGPASVQYQVLLNFDAIASDQSLRVTLPGFNEEVVAVREMKDLECCFLPGFTQNVAHRHGEYRDNVGTVDDEIVHRNPP